MSSRKIRRAEAHLARKLARKAGFPLPPVATTPEPAAVPVQPQFPEPGFPFPPLSAITPATAGPEPAEHTSTGASTPNPPVHPIIRHNGTFLVLGNEDANGFEALKQSLFEEHQPATVTETILINAMAESHWLANRAQTLQATSIDPQTGAITNEKTFSLYMRCQTTHNRAFHKSLNDLTRLRAERRKSNLGFEAQKVQKEKHEMKKQSHYWDILKKDAQACHQISLNTVHNIKASAETPGFQAAYDAELDKHGLKEGSNHFVAQAA